MIPYGPAGNKAKSFEQRIDTQRKMDDKQNCLLCSRYQDCHDDSILLFAQTPILRRIVKSHLAEMQVSFQAEGDLFRVESGYVQALKGLRQRLSEPERLDLRVSRERGPRIMGAGSLEEYARRLDTEWFDTSLQNDAFTIYFQPIVDAAAQSVFAHECLIRLIADRMYSGGEILDTAMSRGSVHLFDSYARQLSVRKSGQQFIPGTKVFINFMPSSIYDPVFCMASTLQAMAETPLKPSDVVFEVVESEKTHDVRHLRRICEYYRNEGFGFALDDLGVELAADGLRSETGLRQARQVDYFAGIRADVPNGGGKAGGVRGRVRAARDCGRRGDGRHAGSTAVQRHPSDAGILFRETGSGDDISRHVSRRCGGDRSRETTREFGEPGDFGRTRSVRLIAGVPFAAGRALPGRALRSRSRALPILRGVRNQGFDHRIGKGPAGRDCVEAFFDR